MAMEMEASARAPARRRRAGPPLSMIVRFLAVGLTILGSVHFYFWWRLVHDTAMPEPFSAAVTLGLVALAASIPAAFALRGEKSVIVSAAFVWMGSLFLLLASLVATDVLRTALHAAGQAAMPRAFEGGAALFAASLVGVGLVNARRLGVKEAQVSLERLPASLDGLVVAQITDLHIGSTIGRAMVEEVVAQANALKPDLIVITGDLADGDPRALADAAAPLGKLSAKHGVWFVTGNHEYFGDVEGWLSLLRSLGIRPLRNERVSIGDGAASFDLAGIDDTVGRWTPGHGPDLPKALAGRDESRELVLLAHRPTVVREAAKSNVGLVISGHTHGGQIWPFHYLVKLDQPWLAGLHRVGERTQLYVSEGTGWWGPPMRLGTTREVTKLVLRARPA